MNYRDVVTNEKVFGLNDTFMACQYSYKANLDEIKPNEKPLINCANTPIGSGHDNALMGVVVEFDLTFTNKAWVEMERYHFADIVMSQSTMHTITKFDLNKVYNEYVDEDVVQIMRHLVDFYNNFDENWKFFENEGLLVDGKAIDKGKHFTKEEYKNYLYLQILYTNPSGMKLTARMVTNYRQLRTIYSQRKYHRLPEWRAFCEWIETLPMAKELICNG